MAPRKLPARSPCNGSSAAATRVASQRAIREDVDQNITECEHPATLPPITSDYLRDHGAHHQSHVADLPLMWETLMWETLMWETQRTQK